MKSLIIANGFAGLLLAASFGILPAAAADLPSRTAPILTAPLPLLWNGPYVGAHIGGAFADWDTTTGFAAVNCNVCGGGETATGLFDGPSTTANSLLGGVQAGYNWQYNSIVFGIEGDFSGTGAQSSRGLALSSATLIGAGLGAITDPIDGFSGAFKSSIDWVGTARGRLGFATGNFLIYATGGLAFAEVSTEANYFALIGSVTPVFTAVSVKDDGVETGWTIGAGLEAALDTNWSVKLEYNYIDLGKKRSQLGFYIDNPVSLQQALFTEEDVTLQTVKLGVNYRFWTQ